jgi:hypothetical protein
MKTKPELVPVPIDPGIYHEKILEIAERLYETLTRQLDPIACPIPTNPIHPTTIRGDERSHL